MTFAAPSARATLAGSGASVSASKKRSLPTRTGANTLDFQRDHRRFVVLLHRQRGVVKRLRQRVHQSGLLVIWVEKALRMHI
jgi:hypothetical protein